MLRNETTSASTTRRVLITGGSGFLGFRLATMLSKQGVESVLLDIAPPKEPLPHGVTFRPGSVVNSDAVDAAVRSPGPGIPPVDAVFHVASYGMSGRELRNRSLIEAVNVGGTRNVVEACLRHGTPRLVYVSTCNVMFVGRPITGDDETAPYPPPTAYKDHYSATKARAERLVLEANGRPLQQQPQPQEPQPARDSAGQQRQSSERAGELQAQSQQQQQQGRLYTCCIRSTGIWGPGETRHQPRVIRMVRAGLFQATFGDRGSLSDWIHVDNLVQMLILAERALRIPNPDSVAVAGSRSGPQPAGGGGGGGGDGGGGESTDRGDGGGGSAPGELATPCVTDASAGTPARVPISAGQVYYASDGAPINNFLHFRPFIEGLGYAYPSLNVPFVLVYGIAGCIEYAWPVLQYFVTDPPLTRMEVDKCCVMHWFSIDKARRELGYRPQVYDRQEVVSYMQREGWASLPRQNGGLSVLMVLAILAVLLAMVTAWVYGRYGMTARG